MLSRRAGWEYDHEYGEWKWVEYQCYTPDDTALLFNLGQEVASLRERVIQLEAQVNQLISILGDDGDDAD